MMHRADFAGSDSPAPSHARDDGSGIDAFGGDALAVLTIDAIRDHAIVALDSAGRILSWSGGAVHLTGYDPDEARGRSYSMLDARPDTASLGRILETAREDGRFHQQRWWRHRDGGLARVDESIHSMEGGGFVVLARDLSARDHDAAHHTAGPAGNSTAAPAPASVPAADPARPVRERASPSAAASAGGRQHHEHGELALRAELRAAERRAALLVEASSILVATALDLEATLRALVRLVTSRLADWCTIHRRTEAGEIVRATAAHRDPRLEAPLVAAADEVFGGGWATTVREVITTGRARIFDAAEAAEWFDDATAQRRLNEIGFGSVVVAPLTGRHSILGALTLVKVDSGSDYDREDLALAEELGRRAAIALDNAALYREAQDANRAKADFLAVISHELRTPLNAIMGYSDLLNQEITGPLSDQQHRQVERIRASARHLLQLIEEILGFARMEGGGEEVRIEPVPVEAVIEDAMIAMEPVAEAKDLELRAKIETPGVVMETDPDKLRQILLNLLSNAVKFTARGSVTLRFAVERENAVFDVADTGMGIPEDQIDRIFDPFWQYERPNTRRFGGTGLGLSLSRRYVRLLNGEITVRSRTGADHGSEFRVTLPLRGGAGGGPAAPAPAPAVVAPESARDGSDSS